MLFGYDSCCWTGVKPSLARHQAAALYTPNTRNMMGPVEQKKKLRMGKRPMSL